MLFVRCGNHGGVSEDQTAIKYIPLSNWNMAQKWSKRVDMFGIDGKHQSTAIYVLLFLGSFLPIQQGKP